LPFLYTPYEIQCSKCLDIVLISALHSHYSNCDKKNIKECLNVIIEENTGKGICKYCKRKFTAERIEKHQDACKTASKKRPLYDMLKKRTPFFSETTSNKMSTKRASIKLIYPNSKWQKQHLDLLRNLRQTDDESIYEDYITCPYYTRKFAPVSGDKHIEICKNILNKPKPPPSVISQRFPNIKKMEQPLSIRTNSMKSLWRPDSMHNNKSFIDKRNVTILSNSIDEPFSPSDTSEVILNTSKIPKLKPEYSYQHLSVPDPTPSSQYKTVKDPERYFSGYNPHLKPSATVNYLEAGKDNSRCIKSKVNKIYTDKKRSNSTQRINECSTFCTKCNALIPSKAKFV
jgi:zinc-finger of a C2HC-type